jgi:hypothetical protein
MINSKNYQTAGYLVMCDVCGYEWSVTLDEYDKIKNCPRCDPDYRMSGNVAIVCEVNKQTLDICKMVDMGFAKKMEF